jgi:hypothetical protein
MLKLAADSLFLLNGESAQGNCWTPWAIRFSSRSGILLFANRGFAAGPRRTQPPQ